jgi:hypothetical protein
VLVKLPEVDFIDDKAGKPDDEISGLSTSSVQSTALRWPRPGSGWNPSPTAIKAVRMTPTSFAIFIEKQNPLKHLEGDQAFGRIAILPA